MTFLITFPVIFGVLLLPGRLLVVLLDPEEGPSLVVGVVLTVITAAALAGSVALHVRMWRTFPRDDGHQS